MESLTIEDILEHYLIAALWSSTDENGQPLDDNYSIDDIDTQCKELASNEITCWLQYCNELRLIDPFIEHYNDSVQHIEARLGHDFWLTRNGHGAGFWDRGLGQLGNQLTTATKTFGSVDAYVGDDKQNLHSLIAIARLFRKKITYLES